VFSIMKGFKVINVCFIVKLVGLQVIMTMRL